MTNKKPKILPMKEKCSHKAIEWKKYKENKKPGDGTLPPMSYCLECEECKKLKSEPTPSPEKYECECGEEVKANGEHICREKWEEEYSKMFDKVEINRPNFTASYSEIKSFISNLLTSQREEIVKEIEKELLKKGEDYYCTEEHLGYHDKNCRGCEISREQIKTKLTELKKTNE